MVRKKKQKLTQKQKDKRFSRRLKITTIGSGVLASGVATGVIASMELAALGTVLVTPLMVGIPTLIMTGLAVEELSKKRKIKSKQLKLKQFR